MKNHDEWRKCSQLKYFYSDINLFSKRFFLAVLFQVLFKDKHLING